MPLKIRNWDKHYETSESRKLVSLQWVKIPTRQDSLAYRLIAGHKRGAEIFAAWVLMVQVASKGRREERGNLPLSPEELGIVTGFPVEIFSLAIDFLKSPKIAWIEQSPDNLPTPPGVSGESPDNPPSSPQQSTGEDSTEKTKQSASREDALRKAFDEFRRQYPGTHRGFDFEWGNFVKKYGKQKAEIIPLLMPALKNFCRHHAERKTERQYLPHLRTWINNQAWTEEYPEWDTKKQQKLSEASMTEEERQREWRRLNVI